MSLQGLVSGAECAVPFNPLSQVLKHTEGDRSLQQVTNPSRLIHSLCVSDLLQRIGSSCWSFFFSSEYWLGIRLYIGLFCA